MCLLGCFNETYRKRVLELGDQASALATYLVRPEVLDDQTYIAFRKAEGMPDLPSQTYMVTTQQANTNKPSHYVPYMISVHERVGPQSLVDDIGIWVREQAEDLAAGHTTVDTNHLSQVVYNHLNGKTWNSTDLPWDDLHHPRFAYVLS